MAKKSGLGKGLGALMLENNTDSMVSTSTLNINEITPNKEQPRKTFDETALEELADSIRQHGVLQPLLVRPLTSGGYQLVAGERRWRASRLAELKEVPVIIKELSDTEAMEIAIIENLQREDLNPIEEADFRRLLTNADTLKSRWQPLSASQDRQSPTLCDFSNCLKRSEKWQKTAQFQPVTQGHFLRLTISR